MNSFWYQSPLWIGCFLGYSTNSLDGIEKRKFTDDGQTIDKKVLSVYVCKYIMVDSSVGGMSVRLDKVI